MFSENVLFKLFLSAITEMISYLSIRMVLDTAIELNVLSFNTYSSMMFMVTTVGFKSK